MKFLITAALPYVNGVPHLGHLISTHLPSDILARYLRLKYGKENVLHIGGTDEHGTATELKALEENMEAKELCDKYFPIHKEAYNFFRINYDFFGRTTLPLHYLITQEFFLRIFKAKLIKEVKEEVFKCKETGQILADRYVEGICPKCGYEKAKGDQCEKCGSLLNPKELINPKSKYCKSDLEVVETYNLSINLPEIKKELIEWIEKSPFNDFTKNWSISLAKNIKERTITRDLKFGVPLPIKEMKKMILEELINQKCLIKEKVEKNKKNFSLIEFDKTYKEEIKALIKKILISYGFIIDKKREELINKFVERNYPLENKHYEELIKKILDHYEKKVFYVWFDAPIGYLTNTIYASEEINFSDSLENALKKIKGKWKNWFANKETKIIHFIGKDNIPFHTNFWPGMIISYNKGKKIKSKILNENLNLPYNVVGYHYLNYEGQKFSKSQGTGIFLDPENLEILKEIPIDAWRFYLISILPEQKDSDFSWADFEEKYNKELLGNFANFVYRVLSFAKKNDLKKTKFKLDLEEIKKKIKLEKINLLNKEEYKELKNHLSKFDENIVYELANLLKEEKLREKVFEFAKELFKENYTDFLAYSLIYLLRNNIIKEYEQKMDPNNTKIKDALFLILKLSDIGNKEFQKFEPWRKIKENKEETEKFIVIMLNLLYSLAYLTYPFMPETAEKIAKMLNIKINKFGEAYKIKEEFEIKEIKHLFEKINFKSIKEKINKSNKNPKEKDEKTIVSIEDFSKVKLRVGKIVKVEEVKELKKLYKLTVIFDKEGREKRTILAGLKEYFKPEELKNKLIVVVYNLKPKKIAGYESQGMLLVAEKDNKIELVTINNEDLLGAYLR